MDVYNFAKVETPTSQDCGWWQVFILDPAHRH